MNEIFTKTFEKNGDPWVANQAVNFMCEKAQELGANHRVWISEVGGDGNPKQVFTVHWQLISEE